MGVRVSARDINPNLHYVVHKLYYKMIHFLVVFLVVAVGALGWLSYDLTIKVGSLRQEKKWVEESLSIWKESNQAMALQLHQKNDYIQKLLMQTRQYQDMIDIVKLKGEAPKWLKTSEK